MIKRRVHIIMPMAGDGSRFFNNGIKTPKPIIKAKGEYFFKRAINSIIADNKYVSMIVRKEHNISNIIDTLEIKHKIIELDKKTSGAAETCMQTTEIKDDDIIIILDCDLEFKCSEFIKYINDLQLSNDVYGGALVIFESNKPCYSYVETDKNNYMIRTAEKEIISNNAICGAYLFNSGIEFKKCYNLTNFNDNKEKYISLLFNHISSPVKVFKLEEYNSFGTPEELEEYERK